MGSVSVQNKTTGFATWPGHPTLTCSRAGTDESTQKCELDWDVPCKIDSKLLKLNLTGTAQLNSDKSKTSAEMRTFNVLSAAASCSDKEIKK